MLLEVGWAPGPIWGGAENLAAIEIRFPDRQARGKSDVFRSRAFWHNRVRNIFKVMNLIET